MQRLGLNGEKDDIAESLGILKGFGILKENKGKYELIVDLKFIQEILNSHEIYRSFI